ncbi:hypothetical protein [uncultured Mycolicibacterium sp.]|uniref:hypothetical protein n=1 Tax=uncultured Mycolicibacterium sp. TaxID=2320817 RepID=UPI002638B470|nr:hypothetical protein [uncultured Mycolicibacterium sp.]
MEGDAGTSQLNPSPDADDRPDESLTVSPADPTDQTDPAHPAVASRPSRLGRGWLVGICAGLVLATAAVVVGGVLAWRAHQHAEQLARDEAAALAAAQDCVSATQAPDVDAMTAAQAKIIDCATGDFAAQAALYSSMLVDAYRVANVKVAVSDMRAAVEHHHDDGAIDVLVALRVKVTNTEAADQEQGYRLRVRMAPDAGTWKIARLDQVTS